MRRVHSERELCCDKEKKKEMSERFMFFFGSNYFVYLYSIVWITRYIPNCHCTVEIFMYSLIFLLEICHDKNG